MTVADALNTLIDAAVWSIDLEALRTLPRTDPSSWAGSVQTDFVSFGNDFPLVGPTGSAPACLDVAVAMMVKDEADIIFDNLRWLYFGGVRRFIVMDNGSTDATRAELLVFRSRFPQAELIILDDARIGYVQAFRTTGMMRLAVSLWPTLRWIFPIDADEFLVAAQGFGPLLDLPDTIDAVTLPKVVHFCDSTEPVSSPLPRMRVRNKLFTRAPNVACRASVRHGVSDGNHHAALIDGSKPVYSGGLGLGLYYREFQVRGFDHFRLKTLNGGPAILAGLASGQFAGGDHWLQCYRVWQAEGDAGLRALYEQGHVRQPGPDFVFDPFEGVAGLSGGGP